MVNAKRISNTKNLVTTDEIKRKQREIGRPTPFIDDTKSISYIQNRTHIYKIIILE